MSVPYGVRINAGIGWFFLNHDLSFQKKHVCESQERLLSEKLFFWLAIKRYFVSLAFTFNCIYLRARKKKYKRILHCYNMLLACYDLDSTMAR